jgi:hypothetical protein
MPVQEITIRADLEDISGTIKHLYELADYFKRNNVERWPDLWRNVRRGRKSIFSTRDQEFIKAVEEVYNHGRDTAVTLSRQLRNINDIESCPCLKDYIDEIRSYQGWIDKDSENISKCEQVISEKNSYNVDYSSIKQMNELHKEQLKILGDLDEDLLAIENSEKYKLENKE